MNFLNLIWLIPLFPAAGFVINGLFGKRMHKTVVGIIGAGAVLISFIFSAGAVYQLIQLEPNIARSRSSSMNGSRWAGAYEERRTGELLGRLGISARSAVVGDDPGRYGYRFSDSRLFHRLHARRGRLLSFLRLSEPLHVLDAHAGPRKQLPDDVHRLGRCGPLLVFADRVLLS